MSVVLALALTLLAASGALLAGCDLQSLPNDPTGPFADARNQVTALAADPDDAQRLFLGTRDGLFISADGGAHWPKSAKGAFATPGVAALALDASQTSDPHDKSVKGATLWLVTDVDPASLTQTATPAKTDQKPASSSTSSATPSSPPTQPATPKNDARGAVWLSHDGGASWRWASAGLPGDARQVWAGATIHAAWVALASGALLGTSDDGKTWKAASALPDNALPTSLLARAGGENTLLAGSTGGVYRSTDSGQSWQAITVSQDGVNRPLTRVLALVRAPSDANVIYCQTDRGLFRSTDGGGGFGAQTFGQPASALAVGAKPDILYGAVGVQVERSADAGQSWTPQTTAPGPILALAAGRLPIPPTPSASTPAASASPNATTAATTPPTGDLVYAAVATPATLLSSRDAGAGWTRQGG